MQEDSLNEIKRQINVVEDLYESTLNSACDSIARYKAVGDVESAAIALENVEFATSHLLLMAQVYLRVYGDKSRAINAFGKVCDWSPLCLDALSTLRKAADASALPEWRVVLGSLLCYVMAGDWGRTHEFSRSLSDDMFQPIEKVFKQSRQISRFSQGLRNLICETKFTYFDSPTESPKKLFTQPYGRVLGILASGDLSQLSSAFINCNDAFKDRIRSEESALNEYGYGELSQLAVFDVIGTALCKIFRQRGGMEIIFPDDLTYPKDLIIS